MEKTKGRSVRSTKWCEVAGHILVAQALTLSMACGAGAGVCDSAYADATGGTITIEKSVDNREVTYDAHLLFTGHVGAGNRISDMTWKNRATHDAVVAVISRHDAGWTDPAAGWDTADAQLRGESAQKAAEFIATHIRAVTGSGPSTDATIQLAAQSFGDDLAEAVEELEVAATLSPGRAATLSDGYYLFVTTPSSLSGVGKAGTSPVFAVVGDQETPVRVREKTSVPTIAKRVRDDSTGTFGYAADMHAGQQLAWRLTGTVADNIASYKKYSYRFVDTIDPGLTVAWKNQTENSVRVYLHRAGDPRDGAGMDVTDRFETKTLASRQDGSRVLTVGSYNIKKRGIDAKRGDWFTVEYTCTVNERAVLGNPGNDNVAKLVFSNNPLHSGKGSGPDVPDNPDDPEHPHFPGEEQPENPSTGETEEHRTRTYVYALNLHKQDKQNAARALQGAKFTIQVKAGDDPANPDEGKYVQADGSLGDSPHEFVTDAQGNFAVKNIDRGTYILKETAAPLSDASHNGGTGTPENGNDSSYERLGETTVVIGSNVEEIARAEIGAATMLSMSAQAEAPKPVFGSSSDIHVADSVAADGTVAETGVHAESGTVNLVVREAKETRMPLTGGTGLAICALAGAALMALGAALMRKKRRGGIDGASR